MRKVLIAGSIAFLVAVTAGTALGQDSLLQAFAAADMFSQVARVVIIGLLISLFVSVPPRSLFFRSVLWAASAILTTSVAVLLSDYYVGALDAALYVVVAIIFALEALESPVLLRDGSKKIHVVYKPKREVINI